MLQLIFYSLSLNKNRGDWCGATTVEEHVSNYVREIKKKAEKGKVVALEIELWWKTKFKTELDQVEIKGAINTKIRFNKCV